MAYTAQAQHSFTLQDELGVKGAITMYALLDPTSTVAQVVTDWQTMAALIGAVSGGAMPHGKVSLILVPSPTIPNPTAGARIEQTGVFDFGNASNPRAFGQDIIALLSSKISGGKINLADANVLALTTAMTTPTGHTEYANNQFLALNVLKDAFVSFRKRRQQLRSLTFEL